MLVVSLYRIPFLPFFQAVYRSGFQVEALTSFSLECTNPAINTATPSTERSSPQPSHACLTETARNCAWAQIARVKVVEQLAGGRYAAAACVAHLHDQFAQIAKGPRQLQVKRNGGLRGEDRRVHVRHGPAQQRREYRITILVTSCDDVNMTVKQSRRVA